MSYFLFNATKLYKKRKKKSINHTPWTGPSKFLSILGDRVTGFFCSCCSWVLDGAKSLGFRASSGIPNASAYSSLYHTKSSSEASIGLIVLKKYKNSSRYHPGNPVLYLLAKKLVFLKLKSNSRIDCNYTAL